MALRLLPSALAFTALGLIVSHAAPRLRAQEAGRPAEARYEAVARALSTWIEAERRDKGVPAIMIALVDDHTVVWSAGFGLADPATKRPATPDTVVRVGSVSKLFTDLALMRQVERGTVDLDAPLAKSLPELTFENPFDKVVTLRHLMAHRAGLVREPPVGNYFDPTEPTLAATLASLARTKLVYEPGTRTKYSNAGIAAVGRALERATGQSYDAAIAAAVLEPLGMTRSSFRLTPALKADLAYGEMWTLDGRTFPAPGFDWGIAPAASLYSTVDDLGKFLAMLFAGGKGPDGAILKPETLQSMFEPQLGGAGFGLGFMVGSLDGAKRVGHGGAVYGFATEVGALPEEKLGVVVVSTRDCANAVSRRIADQALRMMRAVRRGEPLPTPANSEPVPAAEARALVGRYGEPSNPVTLRVRDGELIVSPAPGAAEGRVRRLGEKLVIDDVLSFGVEVARDADGLTLGGRHLPELADQSEVPPTPPERWRGLIGEYGWDHDVLYILEQDGQLQALIEWFFLYPITEVEPDVFRFPASGLYDGELLRFQRGPDGRATRVVAADVTFERHAPAPGVETGRPFRVTPARSVAELRQESLKATPPVPPEGLRAPELVELTTLDPTIRLDIRYAGTDNFLGTPFYDAPRAFLQRPAAEALVRAQKALAAAGYGLLIHDAYRPWYVTRMFWEATRGPDRGFVANPAEGSKHNRGCAVDLTLCDLKTGEPVEMVGAYDEFSPRSAPNYPGGTGRQRWHRELLRRTLEREGFTVNVVEWWHFDFADWPKYPLLNLSFEAVAPKP